MRPSRCLAIAAWLLWLYLAFTAATGWMRARPERSLIGTWSHSGRKIECRADGSVRSDTATKLITWQGSRFVFKEAELTAAVREYTPAQTPWDLALARQCGIIRSNDEDLLDGPHVNHKQVGDTIEATVKWTDPNHFKLGEACYTKEESDGQ